MSKIIIIFFFNILDERCIERYISHGFWYCEGMRSHQQRAYVKSWRCQGEGLVGLVVCLKNFSLTLLKYCSLLEPAQ